MLQAARDAGIEPCLHHFTLPGWFGDDMGGFVDDRARGYYWPRHVDFMAETFGDLVFGWKPIDEPTAYVFAPYLMGVFPPGEADLERFAAALRGTYLANHGVACCVQRRQARVHDHEPRPSYPGVRGR